MSDVRKTEVWKIIEWNGLGVEPTDQAQSRHRRSVLMDEMFFAALQHQKKKTLRQIGAKNVFFLAFRELFNYTELKCQCFNLQTVEINAWVDLAA